MMPHKKESASPGHIIWITSFLIALITFLIYLHSLQNGFVYWDDNVYVYENKNIRSIDLAFLKWLPASVVSSHWHPLTVFSFAIDHSIWGLNPLGYHLTSITLHALNTFMVFILAYLLIKCRTTTTLTRTSPLRERETFFSSDSRSRIMPIVVSATTALLFGAHPLHVESVAWISERKDVLYAFFYLASILAYIKYTISGKPNKGKLFLLSVALFIFSLMSKPMAVSLPIVLLILDFYPFQRIDLKVGFRNARVVFIEKIPFILLSIISSIITVRAMNAGTGMITVEQIPVITRLATAARSYVFYIVKIILPFNLAPIYPYPLKANFLAFEYSGSLIIISLITLFAISSLRKNSIFFIVWLYYTVTIIPVLGIVKGAGLFAAADRYTYLPSLGPFFLVGMGVWVLYDSFQIKRSRIALITISLLFIGTLIYNTINQIGIWHDSISLWSHEIRIYPVGVPIAYNNRGNAYNELGSYAQAINDFNKAIEFDPKYENAYSNRGIIYNTMGMYANAESDLNKAIQLSPLNATFYINRGLIYNNQSMYAQAMNDFSKAIELSPDYGSAYEFRGITYNNLSMFTKAESDLNRAIELNPRDAMAYNNRGITFAKSGKYQNAIIDFRKAIEIEARYVNAYRNMGFAYKQLGENEKANACFSKAAGLEKPSKKK